jgi:multisubunit Na+/H+ antiporter MnhC subunit
MLTAIYIGVAVIESILIFCLIRHDSRHRDVDEYEDQYHVDKF